MYGALDFINTEVSTGTTIMAVEFKDGVIIGADSRTSMGNYVANRVTDKLTKITDKIYCCRSGSAADTQAIAGIVAYALNFQENQSGEEALVSEAATEMRKYCYDYRDSLMAGIIVAGYDKRYGGQVYSIPLGGMCIRQACTIGGSGSSFVYGFIRENYREGMEREECVEFVKKTVFHAMHFDGSSGGVCRIGIITKDGVERRVFLGSEDPANIPTEIEMQSPPSVDLKT
ncbi:proteasome subunit beta type-6 [Culicoides brevitarsis]|uniref:proteasome subunit beta type-6 n=1 Tax=Culicoides brevitarsis TaxID=469753 RepID=UPI00307C60D0